MNKEMQYILWGSAGHALVLSEVIESQGGEVIALFDNNDQAKACLDDVPIYYGNQGYEAWLAAQRSPELIYAAVAIGGDRGKDRQLLVKKFESSGLRVSHLVHSSATLSKSARVGSASQILAGTVIAPGVTIGSACIINNSANVDHECRIGNGVHVAPGAVLCGCVVIGDNAMIGAGATVLPRIEIGSGSVVGAGAVVTRNVPANVVVVGNPARIVRK